MIETYRPLIEQFIPTTIHNIEREYPNGLLLTVRRDSDLAPPRVLHPAFFGCYDWHSAVHSHWQLIRALRFFPNAPFVTDIVAVLDRRLSVENVAAERDYLQPRPSFERPYGLAWLLQLCAELREWDNRHASRWYTTLQPLEAIAANRFRHWLPKLQYPVRTGTHNQIAFSLGLVLDWARTAGDFDLEALIETTVMRFFYEDRDAPLAYEPSATDFLSPALAEADLMRRLLPSRQFSTWLQTFLPQIPEIPDGDWLMPVYVSDPTDGQLAHFAGLNLSRAWMLQGIANALANHDPRITSLELAAANHRDAGLPYATHPHYMLSHWVPTFVIYLLSERGIG